MQLKQAEKLLAKRSFFRGSPDYLSAAPLLDKAGELYRLGGDFEASKLAFKRCAEAQQNNQSPFRAAQAYENVAKTALQQLKAERTGSRNLQQVTAEARKAYESASMLYVDMGEFGKAADALVKGAQACENNGVGADNVLPLYWQACDLLEAQDKPHFAVDTFRKTLSFLVKYGKHSEAVKLLDRMNALYEAMDQQHNIHKMQLCQIILMLAVGDVSAADALYSRSLQDDSFLSSDDCALAEDLVRAYKMGNEELLQATIRKPGFLALDNQIGRICRKLSVYSTGNTPPPPHQHRPDPSSGRSLPRQKQQPQKQRNPFAPSAHSSSTQNTSAPSARTPAVGNEYDFPVPERSNSPSSEVRDSDYEAMLADALGEVDVSEGKKKKSFAYTQKKRAQEFASPSLRDKSTSLSPTRMPSPQLGTLRASARMDDELDGLEFAMPDPKVRQNSSLYELEDSTNAIANAPSTKSSVKTAYDEFDLT